MQARAAANIRWARTADRSAATAPARAALHARFEREVDPEGRLTPTERAKRAENARAAYFLRLSLRSARVRRLRAAQAPTPSKRAAGGAAPER